VKTILIVDDEIASAEALAELLQEEGYRVYCAYNGREGLGRTAEIHPDLIISDFMMPVMNGGEMCSALRGAEATRHIKILMNSGLSEDSVRAYFDGYDAFMRKPYGFDDALATIRKLLGENAAA
jgi:CheY-like chemotaxis protein